MISWTSVALVGATWILYKYYTFTVASSKLRSIPTVGIPGFIGSHITAWKFVLKGQDMIQEGYNNFYGSAFKIYTTRGWKVVVSSPEMIEDIRRARDDELSSIEAGNETLQVDFFSWPDNRHDPYHIGVIRSAMTRNLGARFPDIKDEIVESFNDLMPATKDWTSVPVLDTMVHITCRTSNRLFVGLPLCRDPDYRMINEKFTLQVMWSANVLYLIPTFLKPIVGRLLSQVPETMKKMQKHLAPIFQERFEHLDKSDSNQNDFITWLLEVAEGPRRTLQDIAFRLIVVNFVAIHSTSMAVTNILYDLAAHPEYIEPLRKEVESVISAHGWSKDSMGKMFKLDSFLKESMRLAGFGALTMDRYVPKDFTFSNGITVPKGSMIVVANHAMHYDNEFYEDARTFKGFRFSEKREREETRLDGLKHQMVTLDLDYLVFGHGRHACPGRFFAVDEIKAMISHILINYDVKLTKDGERPAGLWFSAQHSPHRTAHMLFRKRQS